ncbi:MAG: 2-phosphoglycerate kinase, partial [Candidatus Aenigmarchaeota archaeon]|nr:2-phosphoglycerate kinase [Candidatus Aenigmarchaeota archaeon]
RTDFSQKSEQKASIASEIVQVEYEKFIMPFSKGLLAQSLTSIGLKGSEAHSVGQIVEKQLRVRELESITNNELEEIIYNVLIEKFPAEVANNYKLLRRFQERKIPLVIVIGGATAVGKSTIASNLAFRFGIRHVFGTDIVREAMRSVIALDLIPELHASSYTAWKRLKFRLTRTNDKVTLGFEEQARHVMAGIEGIIERALEEGISLIIEGVHVCPRLLRKNLLKKPNVIVVFLKLREESDHLARIFARSQNVVVKRPAARYIEYFTDIRKIQDHLINQALTYGLPVIENTNQIDTVMTIISFILSRIKTLVESDS